jgi:hypothetical protein
MDYVKACHFLWKYEAIRRVCLTACLGIPIILYSGGAVASPSIQEQITKIKHDDLMITTSKEAFSTIEPTLLKLQTNTPVRSSGLTWSIHEINDGRGKVVGLNASSNGWLRPLSGELLGAGFQLGNFIGRSGTLVYGEHVYGYTWMNVNIVPCYTVTTVADIISEKEFEELKRDKSNPAGWLSLPGENKTKVFFKNVRISKVQKTAFKEPTATGAIPGDSITSQGYVASYLTASAFTAAEKKIAQLRPGTSTIEVIKSN